MDKPTVQQKLEQRKLKPVNPAAFRFMVGLATVLFRKKYNVHFTCVDDITPYHGKPYIVVSNHASRMDYVFTAPGFWPDTFNFVVGYNEFFRGHLAGVLRAMQTVPKKNFVQQPYAIRQMIRIIRGGGRVIILPEGMSSISGANQPCAIGSGHLLKSLKVPVLYTKIAGGYLTAPKFDLEDRPGRVDVQVGVLFTPEQLAAMTADEIQKALDERLYHDDYEWNKTARMKFAGKGRMARNMHQLLFWCPKCGGELCMASEGDRIYCRHCGNGASLNEYYDLLPEEGSVIPETPRVWFDMQREHIKKRVAEEGFELHEHVKLGTLPADGYLKDQATSVITGEGELRLDREGLHYEGTKDGAPFAFTIPSRQLPTYGMCTDVSRFYTFVDGEFCEFYPERESAELWMLATEELHRLNGGQWQDFPWKSAE